MKRQGSKLEITQSSSHNVETSDDDAILESTSPSSPVKTLVRFVSVSKLWASVIRSQDFKKLFLTTSSNRLDRILFTLKNNDEEFFIFSLQTQDSGEALIATYHETNLAYPYTFNTCFVHDLICFGTGSAYGIVVYNTSTRRSITLPKFDSQTFVIKHFLSYDPIDCVYKVLCMTRQKQTSEQKLGFRVLTLGNENSWKMVEGGDTHLPLINHQICINGVLYYEAYADNISTKVREIVVMSFDVRSEKFDLIKRPDDGSLRYSTSMIRYEGKLAIRFGAASANGDIVFWVLEDAKKHGWLKKVFNFINSWNSLTWDRYRPSLDSYRIVDVNDAGEFIFAPIHLSEPPFYVLYYDSKRNSMRRVVILGITEHKLLDCCKRQPYFPIYLFSSQAESLIFL